MNYWHIQFSSKGKFWKKEKKLLEEKALIGLGDSRISISKSRVNQFKRDLQIGDIVLIKRNKQALALVKVIGDCEESTDEALLSGQADFKYQRVVEILAYADEDEIHDFIDPISTFFKHINKYSYTYKYIDTWYKNLSQTIKGHVGLKLKKVVVNHYKILNNFEVSFLTKNQEISPIIVIAGKNGTGKTSLFEYLTQLDDDESYKISYQLNNKHFSELENTVSKNYISIFGEHLLYLPANTHNDNELEKLFLAYIDYFVYDKDFNAGVGYDHLQDDVEKIFNNIDLSFQFKKIDHKNKRPIFEHYNDLSGESEFNLADLSTGERTLLSKIFYLHLCEAKNKVILIDEPELSLHPSWQNQILKIYENFAKLNNCQIIIATHSPHIIGSAKPEYIRVLTKNKHHEIEVLDNFSQSYGLEFDKVLTDIMAIEELRTPDVEKDFNLVKHLIYTNQYKNNAEFFTTWNKLEKALGKEDLDLKLLQLEIKSREKNV